MLTQNRDTHRMPAKAVAFCRRFARKDDGSLTIFGCVIFLCMIMIGGIGIDLMRHEMERTRIQAVADRAVLAAADLDQTLDPAETVHDYFAKAGMEDFISSVDVSDGLNFRTVTVNATTAMETQFMKNMGVSELPVPVISTAEEKISNVEISLVLDISGSMSSNNRMNNLHDAAGEFIDAVIKPENEDRISISLVPYTAQVNAGEDIFDLMNVTELHDWSYCIDFEDSDFDTRAIYPSSTGGGHTYEHMQHFDAGYYFHGQYANQYDEDLVTNPGCPKREAETVLPFSQDATFLKNRINSLSPRANTSIHLGMKWGVALLDPAWRPFNAALPGLDPAFTDRPADYATAETSSSEDTLKTVVLMTDGQNVSTVRIDSDYYAIASHRRHWSNYPLGWYLNRYVSGYQHRYWRYTKYSANQADQLLSNVCDVAKEKNIIIWSIAFEATTHAQNVLRDCASSPSHFFSVDGVEISDAFSSIARQINQLKLTQ